MLKNLKLIIYFKFNIGSVLGFFGVFTMTCTLVLIKLYVINFYGNRPEKVIRKCVQEGER